MKILICESCEKTIFVHDYRTDARFCSNSCKHKKTHTWVKKPQKITDEKEKLHHLKSSFEKNVIRKDGCWEWKGSKDKNGYGVMSCNISMGPSRAHRASWIIHNGSIPSGLFVCHYCDNPTCTNPKHLWIGTHKQNNDDKISKGRANCPPPPYKKGSQVGTSKLNESEVKQIKRLFSKGLTNHDISLKYKVSKSTIGRIKNGQSWKHVTI